MNLLEQLKTYSKVVADSGDFESVKKFKPIDSTTNPSLIYAAAQNSRYDYLIEDAIAYAKSKFTNQHNRVKHALNKLFINFGIEILKFVPGRVSTETDARLSFDTEGTIKKATDLIALYEEENIDRNKILIKIASTWEGIKAAEELSKQGIHCNMTLLFSMPQAIACADAGVQLISPYVGRILDWHMKHTPDKPLLPAEEPGVLLVKNIFKYYKKFGYKTEIMAASFRNMGEIVELSGCDLLTISPELLKELESSEGKLERKLTPDTIKEPDLKKIEMDEKTFRWMMNEDAMATEKLAEGIRKFTADLVNLENIISKRL
jgi:transaldolase